MTCYTVFDRYGSVNDANIVFLYNGRAKAEEMCRYINGEMIKGRFADPQDYQLRSKQEDIRSKVIHFIEWTNNKGGRQLYLDGMEWKREQSDDEYDDDDLMEGVKKMSFNDMVKKQRMKKDFTPLELSLEYGGGIENAVYPLETLVDYLEETIENIQRNWETIGVKSSLNMSAEEFVSTLYKKRDELIAYLDSAFTFIR